MNFYKSARVTPRYNIHMANDALSDSEIRSALRTLADWQLREGKLSRGFEFATFIEAFGFITRVALYAEQTDHYPEFYNVHQLVRIDLTSYDIGGLSRRDLSFARKISDFV